MEAGAAFAWGMEVIRRHGPELHVFYTLDGEPAPAPEEAPLPGYRNSRPVRVGNAARSQLQLGTYGDVLENAALFAERGHILDDETRRLLVDLTDRSAAEWRHEDAGIWELSERRHYAMSKIGCWMALDRAATLARRDILETKHADRWERERDRVGEWIDAHCWSNEKQAYTQYAGTQMLDASILLAARFGFARPERLDLTRAAIQRELCRGPLVYRYSGVEREEGAFLACSFWLVETLAFLGHLTEAQRTMADLMAIIEGDLGLFSEMIDPGTRQMLGNVPQGLSHLAMIHAAVSLTQGRDDAANGSR